MGFGKFFFYVRVCLYDVGLKLMSQHASDMPFPFVYVPTPPLESFNEVPFAAQAPPMPPLPSTVLDDTMRASLINQIDYYFWYLNFFCVFGLPCLFLFVVLLH